MVSSEFAHNLETSPFLTSNQAETADFQGTSSWEMLYDVAMGCEKTVSAFHPNVLKKLGDMVPETTRWVGRVRQQNRLTLSTPYSEVPQ